MANTYEQNNFKNMAEAVAFQEQQDCTTSTVTVVETEEQEQVPRVTLKLRKPRTDRKVQWSTETVDNEHLNKKKSKCCCIFEKPRKFGESSSDESEDECDHCHGHVERKKRDRQPPGSDCSDGGGSATVHPDSSQTITIDN
ncbi:protein phosphatase 1 regulatory subunit 11 isoform X2 [Anoplophora glabripennis]|uniref:protein phosphatase 1 regulatory subunit 11 isoform X2 n=1 Tax=Anoplophora glabripennis TaxID=217634 RepID=UPI0008759942|nr:protein phosphatase 1 regulatory subunit 11 isoform X2 [Anoplophora glabripennis]